MEVTASLGQIGAVKVVPWSFMRRFDRGRTQQAVAGETRADAIVEGTIQRASATDCSAARKSLCSSIEAPPGRCCGTRNSRPEPAA